MIFLPDPRDEEETPFHEQRTELTAGVRAHPHQYTCVRTDLSK
jgi:hypothetical protein